MRKYMLLGILILTGCGLSQEAFEEAYTQTMCERSLECAPEAAEILEWEDASDCVEFMSAQESPEDIDCTYDASFGQTCIDDTKAMSCADYTEANFPESCNKVCTE